MRINYLCVWAISNDCFNDLTSGNNGLLQGNKTGGVDGLGNYPSAGVGADGLASSSSFFFPTKNFSTK